MNKVILIGRLVRNIELKYTTNNKEVIDTVLAVDRQNDKKETDFINIQVWGKQAENLSIYCKKGSKIAVDGELRVETYDKSDGSKGYKTFVLANRIIFLDTKQNKEETTEEVKENPYEKIEGSITAEEIDAITDDMSPF